MKNKTALALLFLIVFLLTACNVRQENDRRLMEADLLMQSRPDSALRILQGIPMGELATRDDSAYYALLLTQARDKNFVVQKDDSLIGYAVAYYNKIGDSRMQAKAHYYRGCVYRDMNLCGKAIMEYLIAIPLAKETGEMRLLGIAYNHTGYLYYLQGLTEEAASIYRLNEKIAIQLKDTSLWIDALTYQGKINTQKGMSCYPEAEEKLLKAFDMAGLLRHKRAQANIAASLSSLYSYMERKEEAVRYAKLNLLLRKDTVRCYKTFFLLGDAYFQNGKYDSAVIYLNKSLAGGGYGTKANTCMRLAEIARMQGESDKALTLMDKYALYSDSLHATQQSEEILNAEKNVAKQQYMNAMQHNKEKQQKWITASAILFCLVIIGCMILYKHYKRTRCLEQKQSYLRQEQQTLQEKYRQAKKELYNMDAIITSLRQEINQQQAEKEKARQLQEELDILQKKRNALVKETFDHSKLFAKIERIINSYKTYDKSDEQLSEEDWECLIVETDVRCNSIITRLNSQYKLSKTEIHLCCLLLTDFPIANLVYIIQLTRNSIYRKEKEIKKKIGCPPETGRLRDFLENY
ncbi:MAG: hypothetical protein K2I15_03850 [Bacteroides sp.]|nr:hypothetical protein [Bacteroides sp.]